MNSYENLSNLGTDVAKEETIVENMPPPIKIKREQREGYK
jgi:hypothetical protein